MRTVYYRDAIEFAEGVRRSSGRFELHARVNKHTGEIGEIWVYDDSDPSLQDHVAMIISNLLDYADQFKKVP